MRSRLLPILAGLCIATLFIVTTSLYISHLMFLVAAGVLYWELLRMGSNSFLKHTLPPDFIKEIHATSLSQAMPHFTLLKRYYHLLGIIMLSLYVLFHIQLLHNPYDTTNPIRIGMLTLTPYEIHSLLILTMSWGGYLFFGYIIAILHIKPAPNRIFNAKLEQILITLRLLPQEKNTHVLPLAFIENIFASYFQIFISGFHGFCYTTLFLYGIVKLKYSYVFLPTTGWDIFTSSFVLTLIWASAWFYDSSAYISGRRWGKNKLPLLVSPNKSWVGLISGCLTVWLLMLSSYFIIPLLPSLGALQELWFFQNSLHVSILAIILVIAAQSGDLVASLFKRSGQVKDSGTLFHSHGGFLDRNDSAIFTCTVFYYLLLVMTS